MNKKVTNAIPTTDQAEKWLDADRFVFEGRIYHVDIRGNVTFEAPAQSK